MAAEELLTAAEEPGAYSELGIAGAPGTAGGAVAGAEAVA